MRQIVLLVLLLCPGVQAATKQRVRVIDGKAVVGGEQLALKQFLTVRRLAVYECMYEDTAKPCTVVTGELLSLLPGQRIDVIVRVDLYRASPTKGAIIKTGSATATIPQPATGKPVPFYAIGPDIFDGQKEHVQAVGDVLGHIVSFTIQIHRKK